jgi:hypothetical protein
MPPCQDPNRAHVYTLGFQTFLQLLRDLLLNFGNDIVLMTNRNGVLSRPGCSTAVPSDLRCCTASQ